MVSNHRRPACIKTGKTAFAQISVTMRIGRGVRRQSEPTRRRQSSATSSASRQAGNSIKGWRPILGSCVFTNGL
jgi:hypothetical protein